MRAAVGNGNCTLDATRLTKHLYQGSMPAPGPGVRKCGFDVLVLAAQEWQPPEVLYPGVQIVRARLDDSGRPMTKAEWDDAAVAARVVAGAIAAKRNVLTTCVAGRNRSGLVNGLTLYILTGKPGRQIVEYIQARRANSLQNVHFTRALHALPSR